VLAATLPPPPSLNAGELVALAKIIRDAIQTRQTGYRPHYPVFCLEMIEEDLIGRAIALDPVEVALR
jgi:hypothetical protein